MSSARTSFELLVRRHVSAAALATFPVALVPTAVPREVVHRLRVSVDSDLADIVGRLTERDVGLLEIRRCPDRPWWRRADPRPAAPAPEEGVVVLFRAAQRPHAQPGGRRAGRRGAGGSGRADTTARRCGTWPAAAPAADARLTRAARTQWRVLLHSRSTRAQPCAHRRRRCASRTAQSRRCSPQPTSGTARTTATPAAKLVPPMLSSSMGEVVRFPLRSTHTGMAVPARVPAGSSSCPRRTTPRAPGHLTSVRTTSSAAPAVGSGTRRVRQDDCPGRVPVGRLGGRRGFHAAAGDRRRHQGQRHRGEHGQHHEHAAQDLHPVRGPLERAGAQGEPAEGPAETTVLRPRHRALPSGCRRPTSTGVAQASARCLSWSNSSGLMAPWSRSSLPRAISSTPL